MTNGLLGKKLGMTQMFDETPADAGHGHRGRVHAASSRSRPKSATGMKPFNLSFGEVKDRKLSKAQAGPSKETLKRPPAGSLREFKKDGDVAVGQIGEGRHFQEGRLGRCDRRVQGKGISRGRAKRHHYSGGPESHGSMFHRAPGSIGASSFPSRVWKGKTLAGTYGSGTGDGTAIKSH